MIGDIWADLHSVLMHWSSRVECAVMAEGCWHMRMCAAISGRNELMQIGQQGDWVLACLCRNAYVGSEPRMYLAAMDLGCILGLVMKFLSPLQLMCVVL